MNEVLGAGLPAHWDTSRLKHMTSFLNRGTAPDYVDEGPVRAVSQAANQPGGIDWARTRFHAHDGSPRSLRGYLYPNDIIVNSTGTGTLGRVGFFDSPPDGIPCVADGHVTIARANDDKLDSRFAYYWLSSMPFYEYIYAALAVGATNQIELSRERLGHSPIPAPPLHEQRRIADFLDIETARIDRMNGLQQEVLERLDEREHAILESELDDVREYAKIVPLRRFITAMDQGSSPQCYSTPAEEGEWGVLKVSCLRPGRFIADANKRLPDEATPDVDSEVNEGDLLVTRANTPDLVGSTAVVPEVRSKLLLSDKIFRIQLSPELEPHFAALAARGSRIRHLCSSASHGTSDSMANLKFGEVKEWPIPVTSIARQRTAVERVRKTVEQADRLRNAIYRQLDLLTERRQSLITAAVTGQFDVTTAHDIETP